MDIKRMDNILKAYYRLYSSKPNLEVIVYGRIEAMISEYCPLSTYINKDVNTCSVCGNLKKYYLRDRFHNDYVLSFDNCMMTIYDYKKRNLLNDVVQLTKIGIKNFRYNFVDEDYDECCRVIREKSLI
jgi:putative protease